MAIPLLGFPDESMHDFGIFYECFGKDTETNVVVKQLKGGGYEVMVGVERPVICDDLLIVIALIEDYRQRKGL